MEGSDESMTWLSFALRYAELPAHQIARLKNPWWNPTWQEVVSADPTADFALNFRWGTRGKRSRFAITNAAAGSSPESPYDFGFGSGASTSGGEDGSDSMEKRRRVDDVSGGCETMDVRIPAPKNNRRSGTKKILYELQKEEESLLEEKSRLQKEIDMSKKVYDPLKAENQRLKNQQQVKYKPESATDGASTSFVLPDLNEPAPEYI